MDIRREIDALPFILSYEEYTGGEHLEVEELVEEEDVKVHPHPRVERQQLLG